jgi:energy-coupling factor transporter transmembrane protein EcfT
MLLYENHFFHSLERATTIYIYICVCVCVCVIESLWAQLPLFQAFLIIDYIINYVLITQV